MGDSNFESGLFTANNTTLYLTRTSFNLASATTVALNTFSLDFVGGTAGEFEGAIYADNGSSSNDGPQSLLGNTSPQSFVVGINSVPFTSPVSVISGTVYWLGFIANGNIAANTSGSVTEFLATQSGLTLGNTLPTLSVFGSNATTEFSAYVCQ
jgi:hypothetical protein